jgi:transcription initiation factor TFIIH subunit 4
MERNRLRVTRGVLYQGFVREKDYQDIFDYADVLGFVLWHSVKQRLLVLSGEGHEVVRAWLKERGGGKD